MTDHRIRICQSDACGLRFPAPVGFELHRGCPLCETPTSAGPDIAVWPPIRSVSAQSTDRERGPHRRLAAIVDNVRSAGNVGSIVRSADGAALERLHLCGITATPDHPKVAKASLGAELGLKWSHHRDATIVADGLIAQGWQLIALESSAASNTPDATMALLEPGPVALIAGNEVAGVDPALLERAPHHMSIPMLGIKDSLNVAVAFGIAAHVLRTA